MERKFAYKQEFPDSRYTWQSILLWIFLFLFIFDYHFWEGNWGEAVYLSTIEIAIYAYAFYLNEKVLIPRWLAKKKMSGYVLGSLAAWLSYILLLRFSGLEYWLYEASAWRNLWSMTVNFALFWLLSILFWSYRTRQEESREKLQIRSEKLELEMRLLKNQLSPHFIFNSLNNLYALIQQGHEQAGPMLAKLSRILRYLYQEAHKEQVSLQQELEAIHWYYELFLLRKPASEQIEIVLPAVDPQWSVPPLLLLSLVENGFKHSNLNTVPQAWLQIDSKVLPDRILEFHISNSFTPKQEVSRSQVGFQNIQQQLDYFFPERHFFAWSAKDGIFHVHLRIPLTNTNSYVST